MKTYFVYKKTLASLLIRIFCKDFFYWSRKGKNLKRIPFPSPSSFYYLQSKSRKHLSDYFSANFPKQSKLLIRDYLKKKISYDFSDYFFFRYSVSKMSQAKDMYFHISAPTFLENIFLNKKNNISIVNTIKNSIALFLSIFKMIRDIFICLVTLKKIDRPDIFIYNKKISLNSYRFKKGSLKSSYENVFFGFSIKKNPYNVYYLNSFRGAISNSIKSFFITIKFSLLYLFTFSKMNLPSSYFMNFVQDVFIVSNLVKLNPIIYFGILEKQQFILLNLFKQKWQKTMVVTDAFVFQPVNHIDYLYADKLFIMNEIELTNININGGKIKKSKIIGNFYTTKKSISNEISKDIKKLINNFNYKVLIATNRIHNDKFYPITKEHNDKFLLKIIELANNNKDSLFMIKTKKGEYKFFNKHIKAEILSSNNITLLESVNPNFEKKNKFEDLINESNMLISSFFCSTVIWQALGKKIPTIAINDVYKKSFLEKYKLLEVKLDDLKTAFNYWKNIQKKEMNDFFLELNNDTKVLDFSSLSVISKHINKEIKESKKIKNEAFSKYRPNHI